MNLSHVNGHSRVPPGFRFHPTEEELLHYYLRKKVAYQKIDLDVIPDVDLNKLEPWDIQERCRIGSAPQNDWYFFSHKDKKYPTGTRTNRATAAGFWKATGRDKVIFSSLRRIGMRKTLVFYRGRAPHGQKSDWIMHEYRLDQHDTTAPITAAFHAAADQSGGGEDGWVVCRVFKKKNYHRTTQSPQGSSSTTIISMDSRRRVMDLQQGGIDPGGGDVMDQILFYMGNSCKKEDNNHQSISNNCTSTTNHQQFIPNPSTINRGSTPDGDDDDDDEDDDQLAHAKFMHLPGLENTITSRLLLLPPNINHQQLADDCSLKSIAQSIEEELLMFPAHITTTPQHQESKHQLINDWAALDRLVASQLNGQPPADHHGQGHDNNDDLFSFSFDQQYDSVQLPKPQHFEKINQTPPQINNELWTFLPNSSSESSTDPLWHLSV